MSHGRVLESRIEQLYESSNQVLDNCALPNGAIVAANSDLAIYPATAENYRFSWARDAAYQLLATHAIDPIKAAKRAVEYTKWLERVQGFQQSGLYIKRYSTNGALDVRYGEQFQPDQASTLMGALDTVVPYHDEHVDGAIKNLARGLSKKWDGRDFGVTQDLWENRETSLHKQDVFTYTLAASAYGLGHVIERFPYSDTRIWELIQDETTVALDSAPGPYYHRKVYPNERHRHLVDTDNTLDASLAGLIYPFEKPSLADPLAEATIVAIKKHLYRPGLGVYRYIGDTYDGIVRNSSEEATAGAWPLLSFWEAIALDKIGQSDAARDMYFDTVERLDREYRHGLLPDNIIPEQLFPDDERQGKGVLPLAWSHAKFVLATKVLNILN